MHGLASGKGKETRVHAGSFEVMGQTKPKVLLQNIPVHDTAPGCLSSPTDPGIVSMRRK